MFAVGGALITLFGAELGSVPEQHRARPGTSPNLGVDHIQ